MSRKKSGADDLEELQEKVSVWISLITSAIASVFLYVQLSRTPLDKITSAFDQDSFTKFGLFILFVGLGFGATADSRIQMRALAVDAEQARMGIKEFAGIILFFVSLFSLFWFHDTPIVFQSSLLCLILVNCWTFSWVIMGRLESAISESERIFREEKDYDGYMKLFLGVEYLTGNWQRKRFATLISLAIFQLTVAIVLHNTDLGSVSGPPLVNGVDLATLIGYFPSFLFLIYVLLSEAWMRRYRQRIWSDFDTINKFSEHFRHSKKPKIDLPEINYDNLFRRGLSEAKHYR